MTTPATRSLLGAAAAVMLGLLLGLHPLAQLGLGAIGYLVAFAILTLRSRSTAQTFGRMADIKLLGTYYGEGTPGPVELRQPEGRARMRSIIADLLAVAEEGGASATFLDRMRSDLARLQEPDSDR